MRPCIWINSGEVSGDIHGSLLAKALLKQSPNINLVGMGGDFMKEAGVDLFFSSKSLSILGITEVFAHLPKIYFLLKRIKEKLIQTKPSALIVIDSPDFNFRVISIARSLNIPVYYYISPKVWAWRQNRALFLKKNVKKIISILPFEVDFYKKFSMNIDYIGNPLIDLVNYPSIKEISPINGRIGIMPGSRIKEISNLLPIFSESANLLSKDHSSLEFFCLQAPSIDEQVLVDNWRSNLPLNIVLPENRWEFMRSCEALIAASGTAVLESAIAGVPTIIAYVVSPISYRIGKLVLKVPYIGLPNLIANKEVFPELIQDQCSPLNIKNTLEEWLFSSNSSKIKATMQKEMEKIRESLGKPNSPERAAKIILDDINC